MDSTDYSRQMIKKVDFTELLSKGLYCHENKAPVHP